MADERGPRKRSTREVAFGYVRTHAKAVGAVVAVLAGVATIVAVVVPTPLLARPEPAPSGPAPGLVVSYLTVDSATRSSDITFGSPPDTVTETHEDDVAAVQIGLRNRGDAPAFVTAARLTFEVYEKLDTCVEVGDAVVVTESVDIQLPYEVDDTSWTHVEPLSYRVEPNGLDALELTFSIPDLPVFVQPVVTRVEVALEQDTTDEPVVAGTARLVVPAGRVRAALVSLEEDPPAQPSAGCNERNRARVEQVAGGADPDLMSQEFEELLGAHRAFAEGTYYVPPQPSAPPP